MPNYKNIPVREDTYEQLDSARVRGITWDRLVRDMADLDGE